MKENVKEKIGIITINDNNNYGNRLQNLIYFLFQLVYLCFLVILINNLRIN